MATAMSTLTRPRTFEYHHRCPENFLLVENHGDHVVIHAALDNFSEKRKAFLIREMAVEGFIPEHYQYFSNSGRDSLLGVRWVIDNSWLRVNHAIRYHAERNCRKFLAMAT